MDAEGTRTILPRYPKVAELRAQGKTPEEIDQFVADAFSRGIFQPPSRPGIDYMLSTENITVVDPEKSLVAPFPPHVMFYGPYITNAELGSDGKPNNLVFVAGEGTPHALIIVTVGGSRMRATFLTRKVRARNSEFRSRQRKKVHLRTGKSYQRGRKATQR